MIRFYFVTVICFFVPPCESPPPILPDVLDEALGIECFFCSNCFGVNDSVDRPFAYVMTPERPCLSSCLC